MQSKGVNVSSVYIQIQADAALCMRIRHWKEARTGLENLFPTEGALRWFMRTNEHALIAAGVLLKLPRGKYVDPVPFAAAALNMMRRDAPRPCDVSETGAGGTAVGDTQCHQMCHYRNADSAAGCSSPSSAAGLALQLAHPVSASGNCTEATGW